MTRGNTFPNLEAGELDPRMVAGLRDLQRESGADVLQQLVEMYLRNTPERLEQLERAIASGDVYAVEQIAHAIKGSSASFGATRLAALCQTLEDLGRHASLAGAAAWLAEVAREYQRIPVALRKEFATPPPHRQPTNDADQL